MRKTIIYFSLLILCFLFVEDVHAQRKRKKPKQLFGAGVLLGLNASQIDGDNLAGYNKKGLYGGARGVVNFSFRTRLHLELVFSQKGSRWNDRARNKGPVIRGKMNLDYMEVPVMLHSFFKADGYGYFWETGLSFARQVNFKVEDELPDQASGFSFNDISEDFSSGELSFIAGFGYQWKNKIGLSFRSTTGLTNIYSPPEDVAGTSPEQVIWLGRPLGFMRNYYLTLMLTYGF